MAISLISWTIRDADGDKDTVTMYFDGTGKDIADYQSYVTVVTPLIEAVVDGVIESASVSVGVTLPGGGKTDPVAGSEVQKGGLLQFSATGTPYTHSIRIPSMKPSLFSGDSVVTGTPPVSTLVTAIVDGDSTSGTLVNPTNKYAMDISGLKAGAKSFRK